MEYPAFVVGLVKDGSPMLSENQRKTIAAFLEKNEGKYIRVTYARQDKGRSGAQNRYYWGVVCAEIAGETGHTPEECHEFLKAMFLPRSFIRLGDKEQQITKSTTTLTTMEFETYLEQVRAFAATELGIVIPMPHESLPQE